MIEFVSYNGEYPILCHGTLKIKKDGKLYELTNCLISGGSVTMNDDGNFDVTEGRWRVELWLNESKYPELMPYAREIEDLVNENVEYGCCGGCI